jgi:hypothetical protein
MRRALDFPGLKARGCFLPSPAGWRVLASGELLL